MESVSLFLMKCVVSSLVSKGTNNIISLFEDPIISKLEVGYDRMIEDIYCSCIKSYFDYLKMGNIEKAVDALMDLSNREGTPNIQYVVGKSLLSLGHKTVGMEKLKDAIFGNPLLLINNNFPYSMKENEITNWQTIPCQIEDSLGNKVLRLLACEVNEGILRVEVSSFGGNISYNCLYQDKSCYGVIDIKTGEVLWNREEEGQKHLYYFTPKYIVFDSGSHYEIHSSYSGSYLCQYSRDVFDVLFASREQIQQGLFQEYYLSKELRYSTEATYLKTLYGSRVIAIYPIRGRKHKYWQTDGNQPHPSIDFDPITYYAMNVRFEL